MEALFCGAAFFIVAIAVSNFWIGLLNDAFVNAPETAQKSCFGSW